MSIYAFYGGLRDFGDYTPTRVPALLDADLLTEQEEIDDAYWHQPCRRLTVSGPVITPDNPSRLRPQQRFDFIRDDYKYAFAAWVPRRKVLPPSHFTIGESGTYNVYNTFSSQQEQGNYRLANAALQGYVVYVGVDVLPDLTSPSGSGTAPPIAIPITPPVSGTITLNVLVRSRNQYGLESQNQQLTSLLIDSVGNTVLPPLPVPQSLVLQQTSATGFQLQVSYPTLSVDLFPATAWKVWVNTVPPDPSVDTPTAVLSISDTLSTTLSPFAPGPYYVAVCLFRQVDSTLSPALTGTITMLGAPSTPLAVKGTGLSPLD